MDTHFAPSTHSIADMIGRLPEPNYPVPLEPNYSRKMYQMRSADSSYPADCPHRPTHLPVNFDYMSESYQNRSSPVCEPSLYDMQDTPLNNGFLEPELCDDLTRGLNIHKSNFPPNNPNKISESGVYQKAQRDLAWKLKSRLTADELISKGILLGREQSPNIIQKRIRLERAKTEDQLKKNLLARPPKGKLIDGNILKEFSGSPRLHQCQMSIMRKQIMKKLNEKISERPRAQALIKKGILCPPAPPLNECLQSLKSSRRTNAMIPTHSSDYLEQASPNSDYYKSQSFRFSTPHSFDPLSSSEFGISRDERDQLHQCILEESSPDCSIIEDSISNPDSSTLDRFSVSSKFPPQNENETCSKPSSLAKRMNVRNPLNESTLKKDMNNSSSLKTRSSKRSRKGIKTYKYHEYIPCPHSGNGLAKSKILGKTHLTKTALTVPKNKNKSNLDMEVQQEQLLLQLHLLRQQYPALMPKIYNDLVTQLSQIEEKEEAAKRKYTLEELESMTVTSLKVLCKEHNVPSTGKKAELIMRLKSSRTALVHKDSTDYFIKPESSKVDLESRTSLELGGNSPGGEGDDLSQSANLDSVPEQISINSPLSEVSQNSAASSDSYTENCSPHNPQRTDCDDMSKVTSLSDPDRNIHEFNSMQNLGGVKFLDDSYNIPCTVYQRSSADDVMNKKQLFKYTTDNRLTSSSSLPAINEFQPKLPSIPCHSKHNFNGITEDGGVYDLLQQLDSYEKYEMNLNRSLPAYQHRNETGYPYEEQYFSEGVHHGYNNDLPMKPVGYEQNSYQGLPFAENITCPPLYTPDMSMEWNTPLASNDPFSLSDLHYDVSDYGAFDRSGNFQDAYHNSLPNSIDCDI